MRLQRESLLPAHFSTAEIVPFVFVSTVAAQTAVVNATATRD
jgi:hypothetical protein